jgi:beta-galactosidase GanA
MIEGGIPVDVVSKKKEFSKYKMIFAPGLWEEDKELLDALLEYAQNGGTL